MTMGYSELKSLEWKNALYKLPWRDLLLEEALIRALVWGLATLMLGGTVAALAFFTPWLVPATASGVALFGLSAVVWQGALMGSAALAPWALFAMLRCFAQRKFQLKNDKRFTWGGAFWHGLNMLLAAVVLGCLVTAMVAFVPGAPSVLGFFDLGNVALNALAGVSAPVGVMVMMQIVGHWAQNVMANWRPIEAQSDVVQTPTGTLSPAETPRRLVSNLTSYLSQGSSFRGERLSFSSYEESRCSRKSPNSTMQQDSDPTYSCRGGIDF